MDIRRFLHAEFVFAALAAAAAGHALVSGVLLGRASSPLSGVLLAALLGTAAWYAWRTGWARWVGPDPEGWAVDLLDGFARARRLDLVVVGPQARLLVGAKRVFVAVRRGRRFGGLRPQLTAREAEVLAAVRRDAELHGADRIVLWLPQGRRRWWQRFVRPMGVEVFSGSPGAICKLACNRPKIVFPIGR